MGMRTRVSAVLRRARLDASMHRTHVHKCRLAPREDEPERQGRAECTGQPEAAHVTDQARSVARLSPDTRSRCTFAVMARARWIRVLAALLAAWFVVFTTEPRALHACPMHDGLPLQAVSNSASAHAAHNGDAHASHSGGDSTPHAGNHRCSCLGACCGPAAIGLPHATDALVVTIGPVAALALPAGPLRLRPSAPEHARPPTRGPPVLHIG
jgi:hypothetical protein